MIRGHQPGVDLVATYSDHRQLDADVLAALLADHGPALAQIGPMFPVSYRTDLLSALRV